MPVVKPMAEEMTIINHPIGAHNYFLAQFRHKYWAQGILSMRSTVLPVLQERQLHLEIFRRFSGLHS